MRALSTIIVARTFTLISPRGLIFLWIIKSIPVRYRVREILIFRSHQINVWVELDRWQRCASSCNIMMDEKANMADLELDLRKILRSSYDKLTIIKEIYDELTMVSRQRMDLQKTWCCNSDLRHIAISSRAIYDCCNKNTTRFHPMK